MKTKLTLLLLLITSVFYSCEKTENTENTFSIKDTKWVLTKAVNNATGKTIDFPSEIDSIYVVFKSYGYMDVLGLCNYSYGDFEVTNPDSLKISHLGPSYLVYCLPKLRMDWEDIFISNFRKSKTYSVGQNQLTIACDSEYNLIFDFVENFDSKPGKVLFCSNSPQINCPLDIEISIRRKIVDTLSSGSLYTNTECPCDGTLNAGIIIDLYAGEYGYNAKALNCTATNIETSWFGIFTVYEDSCSTVFLDIFKE